MAFWKDVGDLRRTTKAKVDAGRGSRSLIEAVEELKNDPLPPPPKKKARHGRTFLISAIFGAILQGTRRR